MQLTIGTLDRSSSENAVRRAFRRSRSRVLAKQLLALQGEFVTDDQMRAYLGQPCLVVLDGHLLRGPIVEIGPGVYFAADQKRKNPSGRVSTYIAYFTANRVSAVRLSWPRLVMRWAKARRAQSVATEAVADVPSSSTVPAASTARPTAETDDVLVSSFDVGLSALTLRLSDARDASQRALAVLESLRSACDTQAAECVRGEAEAPLVTVGP